jgi:hypothetical protein
LSLLNVFSKPNRCSHTPVIRTVDSRYNGSVYDWNKIRCNGPDGVNNGKEFFLSG